MDGGIVAADGAKSSTGDVPVIRTRAHTEKGKNFRITVLKERKDIAEEEQHN